MIAREPMTRSRLLIMTLIVACPCVASPQRTWGEEGPARSLLPAAREDFHLYLLIGQSNMAGRGKMTPSDRRPSPGVLAMDAQGTWRPAAHPLHFDKPSMAGVGLGLDFATSMRDDGDQAMIGLIPCAFGGTSLDQWARGGKLYDDAIARADAGAKSGVIRGVLWHQGESDSTAALAGTYAARLTKLIGDLRHDLETPNLPVVVGELGHFRQSKNEFNAEINRQLAQVAAEVPRVKLASAADLTDVGDQTHFDADSLREFGRRYAAAMRALCSAQR